MPRYQKGTAGKLIVQDWEVITSITDTPVLRVITLRQMLALVALCEFLGWKTRYLNPPEQDVIDAFEAETRYNLMTDIVICSLVIDCIENDTDVIDALNQWLINQINLQGDVFNALRQVYQQNVGGQPMPPSVSGAGLVEVPECDLDVLFGAIFYMVDQMDVNNVDAFESAEVIGNVIERANLLISAIPVFETLPIDEFLDYVQSIWTDDLFEGYSAAVTTGYLDELKCDLFCIAQNNGCTLTIDLMFTYFVNRIGATPEDNLADLISYLALGTWTGTEIPDIFFALQLIVLKYGNQFFDFIGIKSIQTLLAIGMRSPDETWTLICETCLVCGAPDFRIVNPVGFSGGSVMVTDNMDGTWTAVGTAAFDTNAWRLAFVESETGCCYRTLAVSYTGETDNLNVQYNCGADPDNTDYAEGIGTGPLTVGLCAAGMIASDVDSPFTVTWTFERCI